MFIFTYLLPCFIFGVQYKSEQREDYWDLGYWTVRRTHILYTSISNIMHCIARRRSRYPIWTEIDRPDSDYRMLRFKTWISRFDPITSDTMSTPNSATSSKQEGRFWNREKGKERGLERQLLGNYAADKWAKSFSHKIERLFVTIGMCHSCNLLRTSTFLRRYIIWGQSNMPTNIDVKKWELNILV